MAIWFDAHLDLACLAECGRDLSKPPLEGGGPFQPAALSWPTMISGGVRACLGTIFTESGGTDEVGYPAADAEAAHRRGVAQLERYHAWHREGVFTLADMRPDRARSGVRRMNLSIATDRDTATVSSLSLGILMECADPIRSPDELGWWVERGVSVIGMAWWRGSRYTGGNAERGPTDAPGLAPAGRDLALAMDAEGVVHDLSHLSWRAMDDLFELTDSLVIASHSNCSALLEWPARGAIQGTAPNQRHLLDTHIKEIGRRGGVVGLNLVRSFIRSGLRRDDPNDRPSIDEAADHIEHVCAIMGHRRGVGLGSDLDGGITRNEIPAGLSSHEEMSLISDALRRRGWSDADVAGFEWGNWARVFAINPA
ncbi:MAG: dipeptidase [Phycisphaeraceae bacterium]|nr:dipeptidase [Phycisphaeraceae bacterium]